MPTTKPISGKPAMNENTPESGPLPELKPCPFCLQQAKLHIGKRFYVFLP